MNDDTNNLVATLKRDAKNGPYSRQYDNPADPWLEAIRNSESTRNDVSKACAQILVDETDVQVLHMVCNLGTTCNSELVFVAAGNRILSSLPIPEARGCQYDTVLEDIAGLTHYIKDDVLKASLLSYFLSKKEYIIALRHSLIDPKEDFLPIFEKAIQDPKLSSALLSRVAMCFGQYFPDKLLDACRIANQLNAENKIEFKKYAIKTCPGKKEDVEKIIIVG